MYLPGLVCYTGRTARHRGLRQYSSEPQDEDPGGLLSRVRITHRDSVKNVAVLDEIGPVFTCKVAVIVLFSKVAKQHRSMGDVQRIASSDQKAPVKSVVVFGETSRVIISDRLGHTGDSVL